MSASGYLSHPTVAGETIVFASENDLWTVAAGGGVARRLTTFPGDCTLPRLSPDGSTLAFVGRTEGHAELYTMPAAGGEGRRLTFLGGDLCLLSGWRPDGSELLFVSDRRSAFARVGEPYAVPADGQGQPYPLGLGEAMTLSVAPHGGVVLGRNATDPARWKRYRGGTAGDLWIDPTGAGAFRRLISVPGNPVWPMWIGGRIYFLSDHEGLGNLYSCTPEGTELRRHTAEREYFVRFPSTDGTRIVYQCGAEIGLYDSRDESVRRVPIDAPSSAPQRARRFVPASEDIESFAPSPDGTALALVARGQPFTMPLWEEAVSHHGAGSGVRYRLAQWAAGGTDIVYVDDASGYERIARVPADRAAAPRYLTDGDLGRVVALAAAPVGDAVAFSNHRHELLLADPQGTRVVDRSPARKVESVAFSADGRFVAYDWSPRLGTSIIRVVNVASGTPRDVTAPLRTDGSPVWDPEGRYLYFIGTRDFNPVYDALQFDLGFPQATRPFAVALRKDVPSPFVPKPAPLHRDDHRKDDEETEEPALPPQTTIDFDGIAGRVIGFPVEEGDYDQIAAARERVLFTRFPVKGIRPGGAWWEDDGEVGDLLAYDFEAQRCGALAREVSEFELARDHRTVLYRSHERLRAIDATRDLPEDDEDESKEDEEEPSRRTGWLDLGRVSVEVDPPAEWSQMYREAWRLQREHFWDPTMSAVDWERVRDRYAALLPRVRARSELSDLLWEMQGELGTSHAYEMGGDYQLPPQYPRGFLGADLAWDPARGGYVIVRLLRGDSWNRDADSPLAEPGLDVREGDAIVAVDGRAVDARTGPDARLVNRAGKEVSVTLERGGERRRVVVKTLRSERGLRYRRWVEDNRARVHEATGGRAGYLHIPDMGPWGFAEFHRGFLAEFDRPGMVVDARYNRGGHVSSLLLEKLVRRRIGYDVSRWGLPEPYPAESLGGPVIALTNEWAGSDGDIFSHAFKLYKLGPLLGKRTWGGVIGINPYHHLVDGTVTTQPEFSFWFVDVGWGVENYGTEPDEDIDITPQDWRDRRDPQMNRALALIGELIAKAPPAPAFDQRPQLPLPS